MSVLAILVIVVLAFNPHGVKAGESIKIDVCHQAGPYHYVLINVSIHSVNDANGLNGHGSHGGDSWLGFWFESIYYPGQGNFPGGCVDPTNTPTVTATETTPTVTPIKPTVTNTPLPLVTPTKSSLNCVDLITNGHLNQKAYNGYSDSKEYTEFAKRLMKAGRLVQKNGVWTCQNLKTVPNTGAETESWLAALYAWLTSLFW